MKVSFGKRQSSADEIGSTRQPNGGCGNRRTEAPSRPPLPSRTASACTSATSAFGSPACRGNGAHYRPRPGPVQEPTSTRPGQRGHTRTPTRSAERPARTWSPPPACASPPEGLVQDPHRKAHRRRSRPRLPVLGQGSPADTSLPGAPAPRTRPFPAIATAAHISGGDQTRISRQSGNAVEVRAIKERERRPPWAVPPRDVRRRGCSPNSPKHGVTSNTAAGGWTRYSGPGCTAARCAGSTAAATAGTSWDPPRPEQRPHHKPPCTGTPFPPLAGRLTLPLWTGSSNVGG